MKNENIPFDKISKEDIQKIIDEMRILIDKNGICVVERVEIAKKLCHLPNKILYYLFNISKHKYYSTYVLCKCKACVNKQN